MKKAFIKIASIAMLVAGVAFFASCEKENNENGLTTNAQTKIGIFDGVQADSVYNERNWYTTDPYHLFWKYKIVKNENGEYDTIRYCDNILPNCFDVSDMEICAVSLEKPQEPEAAMTTLSVENRRIKTLVMNSDMMQPYLKDLYAAFAEEGEIEFAEDCPINDPDLLNEIDVDRIPAGKYPIYADEINFIIVIE